MTCSVQNYYASCTASWKQAEYGDKLTLQKALIPSLPLVIAQQLKYLSKLTNRDK